MSERLFTLRQPLLRHWEAALGVLPVGHLLPEDSWARRHRGIVVLLWVHAGGLAVFALLTGHSLPYALGHGAIIAGAALLASWHRPSRRERAVIASFGLVTASALIVHMWDGTTEGHFHFFFVVGVLMLYQDWAPFLVALVYVLVHHGLVGLAQPQAVYDNPSAWEHPWRWATIHAGFVLATAAANIVAWRASEQLLARNRLERQYRALFEMSVIGIVTGQGDRVREANDAFLARTGYRRPDVAAGELRWSALTAPEHRARGEEVERAVRALGGGEPHDEELLRADGSRMPALVSLATIEDHPWRWVRFVLDRTEQKRAEGEHQQLVLRMLDTEASERTRIAHELHDDSIQVMTAAVMRLDMSLRRLGAGGDVERVAATLGQTLDALRAALDRTRYLTFELHPPLLHERGVGAAVIDLADEVSKDTGLRFELDVEGIGRYPRATEELLYRTVLECVANVRKHARAQTVSITLAEREGLVCGELRDDGRGFDVERALDRTARRRHLGMASMVERVRLAGGTVEIDSAQGEGTVVRFTVPDLIDVVWAGDGAVAAAAR
jgi:PAS domain S-box-containing protein